MTYKWHVALKGPIAFVLVFRLFPHFDVKNINNWDEGGLQRGWQMYSNVGQAKAANNSC